MKRKIFQAMNLVLSLLLIASYSVRTDEKFIWYGAITDGDKKVSGVSVKVFEEGKLFESAVTGRNIGYGFMLHFNTSYDIIISKEGYLKETIHIDTHVSEEVISLSDEISWEPDILIYKNMPGLGMDEFEMPLARYEFSSELWRFIENADYINKTKPMLTKILSEVDKLKKEAYESEILIADSLYNAGNYEEAVLAYGKAGEYSTEQEYPKAQTKNAKKLLKKQLSVDNGYEQALQKATEYLNVSDFESAIAYYQKALIYKPNEPYPLNKLYEIDSVQSYHWIELNNEYDNYVAMGDSMYHRKNYEVARSDYANALLLMPEKKYPQKMIGRIDSIFDVMKETEKLVVLAQPVEKQETETTKSIDDKDIVYEEFLGEANRNFAAGAYLESINSYKKALAEKPNDKFAQRRIQEIEKILNQKQEEIAKKSGSVSDKEKPAEEVSSSINITAEDNTEESLIKLNEALVKKMEEGNKSASSDILQEIGMVYQNEYNLGKALEFYNKSLDIKKELDDTKGESELLGSIAGVLYDSGSYEESVKTFQQSLELAEEINDKDKSSEILTNIATVYENTYRYDEAIVNLKKSLEIKVDMGDKQGISDAHKNIGSIYYEQNKFDKAIQEIQKSLAIDEELNNKEELGATYNNLGAAYYSSGKYNEAINYYEKSINLSEITRNDRDKSIALNNIGNINFDFSKYSEAIKFYEQSLELKSDMHFQEGMAVTLHNIGNSYFKMNQFTTSLEYYNASLDLAKETNYFEVIWRNFEGFAKTYAALGDYKKAYDYYKEYANSKYEVYGAGEQLIELRERYESSKIAVKTLKIELKKQHRLAQYESERNRRELQFAELEVENKQQLLDKQRIAIISFIIGSLIVLAFAFIIAKQYRLKNKAFHIVADQKRHITDGIDYAARIQKAVLPPEKYIQTILPDHFIINRPRDIVGGDFYWVAKHLNKVVIAVADCTGHGVPGGFMSMLGIAMLNEILSVDKPLGADEILTQLRERVMEALHHKSNSSGTSDGMDISLVILDPFKNLIQFSAAHHTMYLIKNKQLELVKGERVPIGYHFKNKKFTAKTIQLQKGDMIYLTSDGYTDQLGEKTLNRFMQGQFTELLQVIHNDPLNEQKKYLEEKLNEWKGSLEQTDDILILGLRV